MTNQLKLDSEYQAIRAALVHAGINMGDSMDALYRDWRRWREGAKTRGVDQVAIAKADQWWSRHLQQFRSLIDPRHVAARSERARKDRNTERARVRSISKGSRSSDASSARA